MPIIVEIFHDRDMGVVSTEQVHEGLELVAAVVGEIAVARETRQLKIAKPDALEVRPANIRWPYLPANFSIVLTERPIISSRACDSEADFAGSRGVPGVALAGSDIAVVSVAEEGFIKSTTAHEMKHLFSTEPSRDDHCIHQSCLMYKAAVVERRPSADTSTFSKRMKAAVGLPEMVLRPMLLATDFCGACKADLAEQAQLSVSRLAMKTMANASKF